MAKGLRQFGPLDTLACLAGRASSTFSCRHMDPLVGARAGAGAVQVQRSQEVLLRSAAAAPAAPAAWEGEISSPLVSSNAVCNVSEHSCWSSRTFLGIRNIQTHTSRSIAAFSGRLGHVLGRVWSVGEGSGNAPVYSQLYRAHVWT